MNTTPSARLAGLLYLVPTLLGPFSMLYVPSRVSTADDLVAQAPLFRWGIAADLVVVLAEVALSALLYLLFRHLGRALALVAAGARLLMTALQGANVMVSVAALELGSAGALRVHAQAVHVWEVLFALHCVLFGVLVARSPTRASRLFGALLALAGLGYGLNGLGSLLRPELAPTFASVVGLTAVIGEVPFVVWLLARREIGQTAPPTHAQAARS